jgi:hypothetical protein
MSPVAPAGWLRARAGMREQLATKPRAGSRDPLRVLLRWQEVEEDGFSYDKALWGNLASFLPPSFELPSKESHAGMTAAIGAGQFHIPDGPGSAGPRDKIDAVLFATIRYSGDLSKVLEWVEIYALRLCGLDLLMKGLVKLGLVRMLMPELVAPTPAPAAPAPAAPAPATPDHRYSAEPLPAHMD